MVEYMANYLQSSLYWMQVEDKSSGTGQPNIIMQLVGSFIGQIITSFSNGQIQADSSHFIRLFLTKYKKWEYQKEWRLIGKAIYLGKNINNINKQKMVEYVEKRIIDIIQLD